MLANAIEFANGSGEIFLVEPPMKGLCLISRNGFNDRLIYFDPEGKVVGKKYVLPLELSSRNCARLVKTIRGPDFIRFDKVKLSFNANANQKSYSYRTASITLSYDDPDRFFKILVRHKNEEIFPELRHLQASGNKEDFKLSCFPRRWKFEYLRFTELKSWLYSNPIEEISPSRSGNYLIFSNPYAVLMLHNWFDGLPEKKQIDSPLYKLFDLNPETDIWKKAILGDFINNQIHELYNKFSDEVYFGEIRPLIRDQHTGDEIIPNLQEIEDRNLLSSAFGFYDELNDDDRNRLFAEYTTLFMEPS